MIYVILIFICLLVGFYLGKSAGEEKAIKEDPDNDEEGTKPGNLQRLLFTKKQRYEFGRAIVLGNKREIAGKKKKLNDALNTVVGLEIQSIEKNLHARGGF